MDIHTDSKLCKDIILLCKRRYDTEKYHTLLEALNAYYHQEYGCEDIDMDYRFANFLFIKPTILYCLNRDNSYSFLNNGLFEETYEERNNHLTNFDEVLFFRMVRWICLLKVRDQNEFGRWYWIVDLSGYEDKDIIK